MIHFSDTTYDKIMNDSKTILNHDIPLNVQKDFEIKNKLSRIRIHNASKYEGDKLQNQNY